MKGVILAGGKGTRLDPLTEGVNKHLLPIGREPMIWHSVRQLLTCGIDDIMVITSRHHIGDIVNSLGSGKRFKCHFTYRVQEEAGGIAHALALAEAFVGNSYCAVILGDNIFEYSIAAYAKEFKQQKNGARVLLVKVDDPTRYGVAAMDEKHIIDIQEKPKNPKSKYAVVGCYFYDNHLFEFVRRTQVSERGELEITSVNNFYVQQDSLHYSFVKGKWADAGTFESLQKANEFMLANNSKILS